MTPANRTRLDILSTRIQRAIENDPPATALVLLLLEWQEDLLHIVCDLHMRPEANDEKPQRKKAKR